MFGKKRVYLDYAAGVAGNPASPHAEGREARALLEGARKNIATLLEVSADDCIFTSGATESNALAILGSVRAAKARGVKEPHVLYLPTAHASTVENAKLLGEEGARVEALHVVDARVDIEQLKRQLTPSTVLVAMEAVCGETGVVWNTREVKSALTHYGEGSVIAGSRIGRAARALPAGTLPSPLLHVDASQAPLTEKISRSHFGADTLTFDGAKVGVPSIGLLVAARTIALMPLYRGGGQERGLRPGTPDGEKARVFGKALEECARTREAFRASALRERALLLTQVTGIKNCVVNEGREQAPNVVNLSLVGRDTDYLVALLDEAGFAVSTKSACETDSVDGSRAVRALTGDPKRAQTTLRISWGPRTSHQDLQRFGTALTAAVAFLDSSVSR